MEEASFTLTQFCKDHMYEKKILDLLRINDYVQLRFIGHDPIGVQHSERMWVKINEINDETFIGELENDPAFIANLPCGQILTFRKENIIATPIESEARTFLIDRFGDPQNIPADYYRIAIRDHRIEFLEKRGPITPKNEELH